jgi:hypothetical protein
MGRIVAYDSRLSVDQWDRLILFALRWLIEDFCDAVEFDFEYETFWSDWSKALGIHDSQVLSLARCTSGWPDVEAAFYEEQKVDHSVVEEMEELEELAPGSLSLEDVCEDSVSTQAVCFLAAEMRPRLVKELYAAWGDFAKLFRSMWACTRRLDIDDFDEEEKPVIAEPMLAEDARLSGEQVEALNLHAELALEDTLIIGDEETASRMSSFEWVNDNCPLRTRGSPPYLGD